MAINSLADFRLLINRQTSEQERVASYLHKVEVLAHVAASCDNFSDLGTEVVSTYALVIEDVISNATKVHDELLAELATVRGNNVREEFFKQQQNEVKQEHAVSLREPLLSSEELNALTGLIEKRLFTYTENLSAKKYRTFADAIFTVIGLGYAAVLIGRDQHSCDFYQSIFKIFMRYRDALLKENLLLDIAQTHIFACGLARMVHVAVMNFRMIGLVYFDAFRNALITVLDAWDSTDEVTNNLFSKLTRC